MLFYAAKRLRATCCRWRWGSASCASCWCTYRAGRPADRGAADRTRRPRLQAEMRASSTASTGRCRCSTGCGPRAGACRAISGSSIASGRPVAARGGQRRRVNSLVLAAVGHADRLRASAALLGTGRGLFPGYRWSTGCRIVHLAGPRGELCRITGSAWCWSSSSRCSSTGCRRPAVARAARPTGKVAQLGLHPPYLRCCRPSPCR
jgi:hypothetical protein